MDTENVCRCCLSKGMHKDLNATHVWLNQKEVYSEMLNDCFNIILSPSNTVSSICDVCINLLRDSLGFKQQVLRAEQEFLQNITKLHENDPKVEVKVEPKQESSDESDDYFLADAAREVALEKVKQEAKEPAKKKAEPKKKRAAARKAKPAPAPPGKWRGVKVKPLVSLDTCDRPAVPLKPSRSITLQEPLTRAVTWASRAHHAKTKHRENLRAVLQYSNATPFRNKGLLGYTCGYCPSTFPDPADLRSHTQLEHGTERHEFKTRFDMTEYTVKLDITDLTCTLCREKLDNLSLLRDHLIKQHDKTFYTDIKDHLLQFKLKKGDVYDCAMCSSTYETFKMLKQHMNKHYSNYTCSKCDTSFATKRSLNAHSTTHQEGSFKCEYCEKVFSSKPKKHYHEKTKHLGARNISNCPYCNEPFRSYYQRNQHLVKVHNSEAQYKCNVCNKSYILKSLLMYHIKKSHLMERNCQCTECGFRFFSKKALKAHMIKHTGERVHTCAVCHKAYARKYTLREHMRIHDNDRRFRCAVCAHAFVQKCSLKSHLLSNHGISVAASDITSS